MTFFTFWYTWNGIFYESYNTSGALLFEESTQFLGHKSPNWLNVVKATYMAAVSRAVC